MADAEDNTVVLTYKYRLLPTKRQHAALAEICESQRILYNAALEERVDCYRKTGKSLSFMIQCKELTELRQNPEYAVLPIKLQRWTLKRLDDAYGAFFRRMKSGGKPGFPRFRGKARWQSFGFIEFSGITLRQNRFRFKGLPGSLRVHLHRPLPECKPLGCTFTRDHKGWNVCLQYRVPAVALAATGQQVGVDVGLKELCVLSSGQAIHNPRHTRRSARELRRRQRALSRCRKGSGRRRKVIAQVTRLHAKIASARRTYLHQVSARLVREHDLIAVEKLNVKGMAAGMLAKSVHDAAWSKLREMIAYKAAYAGRRFIEVDARNTTQGCSGCGAIVPKELSERRHICPHCSLEMDRDHNAARVILHRAVVRPDPHNVGRWAERAVGIIASVS